MAVALSSNAPIAMSILAIGGQGGGVLTSWLVRLAESQGWIAQSTSVPGVAQRTGATLYHVEMMPREKGKGDPVLSLMPVPGEVDLVVAAEFSEVARAIQRELVSRDRTTLIASTHRQLAIAEKSHPTSGEVDSELLAEAGRKSAKAFHAADMAAIAKRNGSVISASLLGAIAASGALPFGRDAYEAAIRDAGVGVEASLAAFGDGFDAVAQGANSKLGHSEKTDADHQSLAHDLSASCTQVAADLPQSVREIAGYGWARLVDFQDEDYAADYLAKLSKVVEIDGGEDYVLTREVAKYLANSMSYNDVMRVADLKIRQSRFARVRREISAEEAEIVKITEYMHPRLEEVCSILSPAAAERVKKSKLLSGVTRFFFEGGRRLRTDSITGFLQLYITAAWRRNRLKSLRHETEMTRINQWLDRIIATAPENYDLPVEIARFPRLIKGYSDTHERGKSKYYKVLEGVDKISDREDAAQWANRLLSAALQDAEGKILDGALQTISSFAEIPSENKAL